jgi:glucose uptake protein
VLLPTTAHSALLLLVLGFLCLGSWANFFKASRWRYELFYFDFAIGALLLAIIAAFTFGTLGSDMSFADRIVVAGLRSQALAFAAGFAFGLGNLLLLAGVALSGLAIAFPLAFSLAYLVAQATNAGSGQHLLVSGAAILLFLFTAIACAVAAQRRTKTQAVPGKRGPQASSGVGLKSISVCVLGGLMIGVSEPLGSAAFWGDLGLGPYAGILLFSLGIAASTLLFNIFLMNIGLVGGRVTLPAYLAGKLPQHLLGIIGGAIWAGGMLLLSAGRSTSETPVAWTIWLLQGWVLLVVLWGVWRWKELANAPKPARVGLVLGCIAFAAALAVRSIPLH